MKVKYCVKLSVIWLMASISLCHKLSDGIKASPSQQQAVKPNQSIHFTGMSPQHFAEAVKLDKEFGIFDKIQEVLVHYVQHFVMYGKMTMLTKSGRITVPLNKKIQQNITVMLNHIFHLECTRAATRNKSFDYVDPVNKFRFIRNNTVVLGKIIDHANASFNSHGDIEKPRKIHFYNYLKNDPRWFDLGHFNKTMNDLIKIQKEASPSLLDLVTGKLYDKTFSELNEEECLDIGKHAERENISISVQFYEAAVRKLDIYDTVMKNKTQILQEIINFYRPYSHTCGNRIVKLQEKLAKIQEEIDNQEDDEEETEDDKNLNGEGKQEEEGKQGGSKDSNIESNTVVANDQVENKNTMEEISVEKAKPDFDNNSDEKDDIEEHIDENDKLCVLEIIKASENTKSNVHDEL